jgi:hypothetical protein
LLLSRKKDFFRKAGLLEEDHGQQIARLARLEPALLHLFVATSEIRSDKTFTETWTHRELLQRPKLPARTFTKTSLWDFVSCRN